MSYYIIKDFTKEIPWMMFAEQDTVFVLNPEGFAKKRQALGESRGTFCILDPNDTLRFPTKPNKKFLKGKVEVDYKYPNINFVKNYSQVFYLYEDYYIFDFMICPKDTRVMKGREVSFVIADWDEYEGALKYKWWFNNVKGIFSLSEFLRREYLENVETFR